MAAIWFKPVTVQYPGIASLKLLPHKRARLVRIGMNGTVRWQLVEKGGRKSRHKWRTKAEPEAELSVENQSTFYAHIRTRVPVFALGHAEARKDERDASISTKRAQLCPDSQPRISWMMTMMMITSPHGKAKVYKVISVCVCVCKRSLLSSPESSSSLWWLLPQTHW